MLEATVLFCRQSNLTTKKQPFPYRFTSDKFQCQLASIFTDLCIY